MSTIIDRRGSTARVFKASENTFEAKAQADRATTSATAAAASAASLAAFTGAKAVRGYLFGVFDGSKALRMSFGVSDGSASYLGQTAPAGAVVVANLVAQTARFGTINGKDVASLISATASLGTAQPVGTVGAVAISALDGSLARKAARITLQTGKEVIANLGAVKIDDLAATEFYRKAIGRPATKGGGCFRTQFDFIASTGQSNAQGADTALGIGMFALDALGMQANNGAPGTPFTLSPANVATVAASGTETPLFGFAAALRQRLLIENLLAASDHIYRPIVSNDAVGGTSIAQRAKSGSPPGGLVPTYANVMAAFTKAYSDGQAGSLPGSGGPAMVKCLSLLNVDGETDAYQGVTGASYKTTSIQRMADFSTDMKAINNQTETPVELLMQCASNQNRLTGGATITSAGSGGTNGTFALVIPAPVQAGGGSGVTAVGTFTVAGGAVTAIALSNKGAGYLGDVSLSAAAFAASAGLTGAAATLLSEVVTMPIATAQRELGQSSAQHVLVGPYYQFRYFKDYQHPDASGARQIGAMIACAHKAVWIDQAGAQADKTRWNCLQPTGVQRSGKCVWLRFDNAVGPLLFANMPWFGTEPNYGFSLVDSGGAVLTISSVALSGRREVLITAAATIPAGAKVRYGFNTMTTRTDYYSGGGGNLRDSQGNWIRDASGAPLHNWAIVFSENL